MEFGEKLQALRKERGISQEGLAEVLGVSRQAVSKWESGATYPETEKILALCRLFELSADDLLLDQPQEMPLPALRQKGRWAAPALAVLLAAALGLSAWQAGQAGHWKGEYARSMDNYRELQAYLETASVEEQALKRKVVYLQEQLNRANQAAPAAPPMELTDGPAAQRALAKFFYDFGRTWRLDYLPEFEAGQAPGESADYLMWAFTINLAGWTDSGAMSREYVSNAVLTHFAVADLAHTPLRKTWEVDDKQYTPIGAWGYNQEPIYLFRSFTARQEEWGTVYEAELARCCMAGDAVPTPELMEELEQQPPLPDDSRLDILCIQRIAFTWGTDGPCFRSNRVEWV